MVRSRDRRGVAIGTVLLDIGGVVIPSLFESTRIPGFPAGPLGADPGWRSVERGELGERDYWADVSARRPEIDLTTLWRACSYVRGEIRGLVELLSSRVRVVAFTNDLTYWFGDGWEQRFPELALFDAVLEGSRLGANKPDPEAFRRAAKAIGEPPERCLFVDDLEVNCAGARAIGMQALLFDVADRTASIRSLLRAAGLVSRQAAGPVFRMPPAKPVG